MPKPRSDETDSPALRALENAVGKRIRELRQAKKMTQRELSALSEIRVTYINEIEVLGVNLSLKLLQQIAEALGVLPRDLLPGPPDQTETPNVTLAVVRRKVEGLRRTFEEQHSDLLAFIDGAAAPDEPETC